MKLRTAVLAGAIALGTGTFAFAVPANAATTTTSCTGELGAVTVSGNLAVPAGQTCTLTGTTVTGSASLAQGANLFVLTGTVRESVNVGKGAYLDATSLSVGSGINAVDALGLRLGSSDVAGTVRTTNTGTAFDGSVFADATTIGGRVDARVPGEVLLEQSSVGGSVRGIGTRYTHLFRTPVGDDLTVTGNPEGSVVCESKIEGDANFVGNSGLIQLGVGDVFSCAGQNEWGDDVNVNLNTATITVNNNLIHGDLGGYRNTPAPTGGGNTVEGRTCGQFVNLQPTPVV